MGNRERAPGKGALFSALFSQIVPICEIKYGNNCNDSNCFAVHMALILLLSQIIVNKIIGFPAIPGENPGK